MSRARNGTAASPGEWLDTGPGCAAVPMCIVEPAGALQVCTRLRRSRYRLWAAGRTTTIYCVARYLRMKVARPILSIHLDQPILLAVQAVLPLDGLADLVLI